MRKQLIWLFSMLFVVFLIATTPASLALKLCNSANLACSAGSVKGSLFSGEINDLNVSSAVYSRFDKLKWQVSLGRLVTLQPWLYIDARAQDLQVKGWVSIGFNEVSAQDLWVEGTAPVNRSTPFVANIQLAKVNYKSADILAIQGEVSAQPQSLTLGDQSLEIGSLHSQLHADRGFMQVTTFNDEGDVALQSLCSINLLRYSCDLSVDVTGLSEPSKVRLKALATNSVDESMYQYQLTGSW